MVAGTSIVHVPNHITKKETFMKKSLGCLSWAICLLAMLMLLVVCLMISDWFLLAPAEGSEVKAPLVGELVPSNLETYYLKEDRHLAWLGRTTYEVRNKFGGRLLAFRGHLLSPRSKTTAWRSAHKKSRDLTEALFTMRQAGFAFLTYGYRIYSTDGKLQFSIRKSLWGGRCRYIFFNCKPEWHIYRGWIGGEVAYYGIGEDEAEAEAPQFFFYRSKEESKDEWIAFLDHRRRMDDNEDVYEVTVREGEDAALILTAATVIDHWADVMRSRRK